jgi:uncharacterized protein with PhoU and TrkA domain
MVLRRGDEKIKHIYVEKGSSIIGRRIGELQVESETGARIIAVNRGKRWIYGVGEGFKFKAEDRLIIRGVDDGLEEFQRYAAGSEPWPSLQSTKINVPRGECK